MSTATTSVEASLLFDSVPGDDLTLQLPELKRCLGALDAPVRHSRTNPGEHVLLHCDAVQVLIALCSVPFDVEGFEGAVRPERAVESERAVMDRLTRHAASLTVLVTDRPGAARRDSLELKQRICWDVADLMAEAMGAGLVFWSDTDTLYTATEFAAESLAGGAARTAAPAIKLHMPLHAEPDEDEAVPFGDSLLAQLTRPKTRATSMSPEWERVSRGLPATDMDDEDADEELLDDDLVRKGTTYGLIAILAALNAPVAAGALFYNVARGENAHLTAQVVAVTGLGVAITAASLHEKAFAFLI